MVADSDDVVYLLAPAHCLLQSGFIDIQARPVLNRSEYLAVLRPQLLALDGETVLQQHAVLQCFIDTNLDGNTVRPIRSELGEIPGDGICIGLGVGLHFGGSRICREEGDARIQFVPDGNIVRRYVPCVSYVLIGKSIAERLAHPHGIGVCSFSNREAHDACTGRGDPQVVIHSAFSRALVRAHSCQTGPGDPGMVDDFRARLYPAGGIEAKEDLSGAIPTRINRIEMPLQALEAGRCGGDGTG